MVGMEVYRMAMVWSGALIGIIMALGLLLYDHFVPTTGAIAGGG